MFYPIYCARRMIFCFAAFGMYQIPAQQVQLVMYMNLAIFMYKLNYKPLEWRMQNYVDFFNEATICICTMHMLFFTEWVADLDVRYGYGWSLIVIMCLNFLVNIILVVWFAGKRIYAIFNKFYLRFDLWRSSLKKDVKIIQIQPLPQKKMTRDLFEIQEASNESVESIETMQQEIKMSSLNKLILSIKKRIINTPAVKVQDISESKVSSSCSSSSSRMSEI